jgi:NADH-quinone oxidoreductase subunit F
MKTVLVGMGTCGLSAGAQSVLEKLRALGQAQPGACEVKLTGCIGMCFREPLVEVRENGTRILYGNVDADRAAEIYEHHVVGGRVIDEYVILRVEGGRLAGPEIEFMATQERIVRHDRPRVDRRV